ncbi:unnamed protein product [Diamesa serratosioi]
MMLKLFSVLLLITSTVIASEIGSTCLASKAPKYFNFDKGFFYIQGLSNGESVVMYRIPNEKMIKVQNIFTNSDSFYEIRTYNIIKNRKVADYGKDVEIKYKISEKGFRLLKGIDGTAIETLEPIQATEGSYHLAGFQLTDESFDDL